MAFLLRFVCFRERGVAPLAGVRCIILLVLGEKFCRSLSEFNLTRSRLSRPLDCPCARRSSGRVARAGAEEAWAARQIVRKRSSGSWHSVALVHVHSAKTV